MQRTGSQLEPQFQGDIALDLGSDGVTGSSDSNTASQLPSRFSPQQRSTGIDSDHTPIDQFSVAIADTPTLHLTPLAVSTLRVQKNKITPAQLEMLDDLWQDWGEKQKHSDCKKFLNNEVALGGNGFIYKPVDPQGAQSVCFHVKWPDCSDWAFLKVSREVDMSRSSRKRKRAQAEATNKIDRYESIQQPLLVNPWAVGRIRGIPFTLMEKAETDAYYYIDDQLKLKDAGHDLSDYNRAVAVRLIIEAVFDLHNSGYIHRDIKGENFLCFKGNEWRLCNLGTMTEANGSPGQYKENGTVAYMAPECQSEKVPARWAKHQSNTKESDVWSLGMLLLEFAHIRTGCDSDSDTPTWMDKDGKVAYWTDINEFYKQLGRKKIDGTSFGDWSRKLSSGYGRFLQKTNLPPAFNIQSEAPWEAQLGVLALSAIRLKPENRISTGQMKEWIIDACEKLNVRSGQVPAVGILSSEDTEKRNSPDQ